MELPPEKMVELLELKIENLENVDDAVQQNPPQTNRPRPKKKAFPKRSAKKKARRPAQEPAVHSELQETEEAHEEGAQEEGGRFERVCSVRQVLLDPTPKAPSQATEAGLKRVHDFRGRRPGLGCTQGSVGSLVLDSPRGQTRR